MISEMRNLFEAPLALPKNGFTLLKACSEMLVLRAAAPSIFYTNSMTKTAK